MSTRTVEELVQALDDDLIWRKKELTALRFLTEATPMVGDRRQVLLRSGVAILYAHWEGFVKVACRNYLEYVANQRLPNGELSPAMLALAVRARLRDASSTDRIKAHHAVVEFFRTGMTERSSLPYKTAINTESNLSSRVLKEILMTLGLDFTGFATKEKLIDTSLLHVRNHIAHGEYLTVDYAELTSLVENVVGMLEELRTIITNAAALKQFRTA